MHRFIRKSLALLLAGAGVSAYRDLSFPKSVFDTVPVHSALADSPAAFSALCVLFLSHSDRLF